MSVSPLAIVHRDAAVLAQAAAARLVTRLVDAQAARGSASMVLTGGTVGISVLTALAQSPARDAVDWRRVDVWWGDSISEASTIDLAGNQDGQSVYVSGHKLYLGRLSGTGSELFVYNTLNPASTLPLLGSKDILADVLGIRVAGPLAFLATGKVNQEFQVWRVSDLSNITNVTVYNFGNVVASGIDYEPDFIYATGQSTPNFQILYSP